MGLLLLIVMLAQLLDGMMVLMNLLMSLIPRFLTPCNMQEKTTSKTQQRNTLQS